jgi:hypothetical protein
MRLVLGRSRLIRGKDKYALIELLRSVGSLKYSDEQLFGLFRWTVTTCLYMTRPGAQGRLSC